MPAYPLTIRRCQHIKVNGIQCGSPAKRDEKYCYFHEEARVECRQINLSVTEPGTIKLPTLEDANSIQLGLVEVMRLLVTHQIDHKIASLLLRALRTAATNVKFLSVEPPPTQVVIDPKCVGDRPLGATAWSTVEGQEYDLIPDLTPDSRDDQIKNGHPAPEGGATKWVEPKTIHPTNHELAEMAGLAGTSLCQLELRILRAEFAGDYAVADELRREDERLSRWNPSYRSKLPPRISFNKPNPENTEATHDSKDPISNGLTTPQITGCPT